MHCSLSIVGQNFTYFFPIIQEANKKKLKKSIDKPGSVVDNHSSRTNVTICLKQPTRILYEPHNKDSYLVLLRVGFSLPRLLPAARCALTAPFHPYLIDLQANQFGGIFSVALSVGSRLPGVTWHSALWSPDFPHCQR